MMIGWMRSNVRLVIWVEKSVGMYNICELSGVGGGEEWVVQH